MPTRLLLFLQRMTILLSMASKPDTLPNSLLPMQSGLEVLRFAALLAEREQGLLDPEDIGLGTDALQPGDLEKAPPSEIWAELSRGLMGAQPSAMMRALQASGALLIVLPEVAALFGVPQIAEGQSEVDVGNHTLKALDEAAACDAPIEVRFALLTMNVGKSDSPPEHLPVHYRHVERGKPRVEAMASRFGVPDSCRDLALLALAECDRIHRISAVRAGPVASLLDRVEAFSNPQRFNWLMQVTSCDYRAYGGGRDGVYPKAALLDTALKVCVELGDGAQGGAADEIQAARAIAIAQAFRSQRWSNEAQ